MKLKYSVWSVSNQLIWEHRERRSLLSCACVCRRSGWSSCGGAREDPVPCERPWLHRGEALNTGLQATHPVTTAHSKLAEFQRNKKKGPATLAPSNASYLGDGGSFFGALFFGWAHSHA